MTDAAEIAAKAAPIGQGKLQWRIFLGFALGLAAGLLAYTFARDAEWVATVVTYVTGPIGQIFLRLLFMLVIPLLFSALVVGIAEMGEVRALKKIGIRTLLYTIVVSGIARKRIGQQPGGEAEREAQEDAPLQLALADRRGVRGDLCGVGHAVSPVSAAMAIRR